MIVIVDKRDHGKRIPSRGHASIKRSTSSENKKAREK